MLAIADALDAERKSKGRRGPRHGIPILLKGNIDTADRMMTTAGSLALVGDPPAQDATVARKLREAGAILMGKANLSEWSNFRSIRAGNGWSARGGQTVNPYVLTADPMGSSSGSAVATAANLCAAALGTDTDGSIAEPAMANGVVGIKPTIGLASRAGVIPVSHSQDSVGPLARTVADAATLLGAIAGMDPRGPASAASEGKSFTDCTQFLDASQYLPRHPHRRPVHTLEEVIAFNEMHDAEELEYFGQEIFVMAQQKGPLTDPAYLTALDQSRRLAREGLDGVMDQYQLDALVGGDEFLWSSAARAGYPVVSVPAGFDRGLPTGIHFTGRAYSEPALIKLGYAFEQAARARRPPRYLAMRPRA